MKAAFYNETGKAENVLKIGTVKTPKPGPNEVLISVKASGINPSDVKRRGGWQYKDLPFPLIIPHSDGAGTIVEIGQNVSSKYQDLDVWIWNAQGGYSGPGRAFGTAAEFITVPITQVSKLPEELTFKEGACLGVPFRTAHRAIFADGSIADKMVLVQGAGGVVGNFSVQIARHFGATVIGTAGSPDSLKHAEKAGAHYTVNRHDSSYSTQIMDITKGLGVDRIIELEFGKNLETDIELLKPNGIIAAYSSTEIPKPTFPYYNLAAKGGQINLIQSFNLPNGAEKLSQDHLEILTNSDNFFISIGKRLTLNNIALAHSLVEKKSVIGNVVLDING